LFVYHKHGGSFLPDEKQKLMKENWDKLIKLHPDYPMRVQNFIATDLPRPLRKFASVILMSISSFPQPILIVDHQIGGGANLYRDQMVKERLKAGQAVFILTYDYKWQRLNLQVLFKEYIESFSIRDPNDFLMLKNYTQLSEVAYNNLVTYPDPLWMVELITQFKLAFGAKLTVYVHDHYALCPSYTLLDHMGHFCDLPALEVCNICLPKNSNRIPLYSRGTTDVKIWRQSWSKLLTEAEKVVFFSNSSRMLVQKVYNLENNKIFIQPHKYISQFTKKPQVDFRGPLCIGIIGTINYHKGALMVLDIAKILAVKHPDVRIVVIGSIVIPESPVLIDKLPNLTITGSYVQSDLPDLIEKNKINLCFFSSIIPETFSYVTSELIDLKMPVCGFGIGASGERIGQYELGYLISEIDPEIAVNEMLEFFDRLRNL
jgi:glycosyltransferase involved in cell wall biosynthesis